MLRTRFTLLLFSTLMAAAAVPACSDDTKVVADNFDFGSDAASDGGDAADAAEEGPVDDPDAVDQLDGTDLEDNGDEGPVALVDCDPLVPEFCGYPFPSNAYTVTDPATATGRRVVLGEGLTRGNDAGPWSHSDGFSAGTPILTYLPGATGEEFGGVDDIDQSLSDTSPTIVLNAETGELVPHFAEIDVRGNDDEQRSTMIRPVVRLDDDTRYIVAFRGLRDPGGDLIDASSAFAALRDETPFDDPTIDARRDLYDDIFTRLAEAGWERDEVQMAWDFDTASDANNTRWLLHMRDTAFELVGDDGPEYTIESVDTDYDSENIAFRIFGTFRAPNFMSTTLTGSFLVLGDDRLPTVNERVPWINVPFELLIPQSASAEDPAGIVEYGHGLFGTKEQIQAGHFRTFMNEYNYAFCATELLGMAAEDFTTIGSRLAIGDFSGVSTMWDRLHQGFLNYVLLMRMMTTSFAADETYGQYLDPQSAYYHGISQGGIMGSVFLALSPDVQRGALGVMGQPYSLLLFRSVDFNQFLDLINRNYRDRREHQLLVALAQMLWDRVEPTGYTHHITADPLPGTNAKDVLMRVAIGDHQVTTIGGHIMARTLGATHLDTGLRDVWGLESEASVTGSAYVEYAFGLPGEPLCNVPTTLCNDPHGSLRQRETARRQLDRFFRTGVVDNTCAPGDGDEHQVTAEGLCNYPTLSGCNGETEADTQAPCELD